MHFERFGDRAFVGVADTDLPEVVLAPGEHRAAKVQRKAQLVGVAS